MSMPKPPRNAIEIPLYTCALWGVWPPIYILLGLPYPDLDERLHPSAHRIVEGPSLRREFKPDPVSVLGRNPELSLDPPEVDFVLSSSRPMRRGPRRGPGSMQLIPDIGIDHPARALAWMLTWRDLAIVPCCLCVAELANQDDSWVRFVSSKEAAIRQQKTRIRRKGGDLNARWLSAAADASARNAIIAARGTAARFADAVDAEVLLTRALERYPFEGIDSATVLLPTWDSYCYHPEVRELAICFVAPGATLRDTGRVFTHRVIRPEEPRGLDGGRQTMSHESSARGEIDL